MRNVRKITYSHNVKKDLCSVFNLAECYKTDSEYKLIPLIQWNNIYFQRDCTISKYFGTIEIKGSYKI